MVQPIKRLRMKHAHNIRDMGGYETADGKVTAFGRLLRSGGLQSLTKEEWRRLEECGVRTVLDLRSLAEIKENGDQVLESMSWHHCPLQTAQIESGDLSRSALKAFTESLTEGYINIVKNHGQLLVRALLELINGLERGAVLFHCTAGKDRTGVLASAVYYLCGVAREDIIADYEVTYTYNKRGMNRLLDKADEDTKQKMMPLLISEPAAMDQLLSFYEEIHFESYLRQYGLTENVVLKLKKHFLI